MKSYRLSKQEAARLGLIRDEPQLKGNVVMTSSKFKPGDTVCNVNPASLHYGTTGLFQRMHEKWTFAAGLACDVLVEEGFGPYKHKDVIMSVADLRLVEKSEVAS